MMAMEQQSTPADLSTDAVAGTLVPLPVEILWLIATFLDPQSLQAWCLTSTYFCQALAEALKSHVQGHAVTRIVLSSSSIFLLLRNGRVMALGSNSDGKLG